MQTRYSPESSENQNHWQTLKTMGRHLWSKDRADLRFRVVLALVFLAAAKLVNVYAPFLFKMAVDQLSPSSSPLVLPLALIFSYGASQVAVALFGELRDLTFVKVGQHAQRNIALSTFQHLHNLSLDFHLSRQTGGLSRVIERGTRGIQFVLNFMTFNIIPTLLEIGLVTIILYRVYDWTYAVIIFSTICIYILATLVITEWRLKYRRAMNSSETKANTKAIDSLINFETVKYFGNEQHEYKRFDTSLARYEKSAIQSQASLSLLNLIQSSTIAIGLISIMYLAGNGVANGELTVGDFVLVHTYLLQLYRPLGFLGFVYREIKNSLVDMDKMFELIHVNTSVADKVGAVDFSTSRGDVEFKQVSFAYNQDREILKNISFKVPAGKTVAVVGPSGSGKSTLSRLLFRFYDVDKGSIAIDGVDIREMSQESLRRNIGVVPQDTVLFNDSVGYNIAYGKPGADQSEIQKAAHMAKIDEFIQTLPEKYETPVGERGLKLSGGEKQRVAIARTILKNPAILIFDEATSALDSHKEKQIQESLNQVSADRSTLVIAHRLSTIIDADEILVLKKGEIIERGTHSELLALNKEYASLWQKQQKVQEYQSRLEQAKGEID